MEALALLERKIADLAALVEQEQKKSIALVAENKELKEKVALLESSVMNDKRELEQEKALTKKVVDSLIQNIDALVSGKCEKME